MGAAREQHRLFDIDLPAVVEALGASTPLPLVWADDAGKLYLKARQILASGEDLTEDAVIRNYLAEGYTDGDVMALTSILNAMAASDAS